MPTIGKSNYRELFSSLLIDFLSFEHILKSSISKHQHTQNLYSKSTPLLHLINFVFAKIVMHVSRYTTSISQAWSRHKKKQTIYECSSKGHQDWCVSRDILLRLLELYGNQNRHLKIFLTISKKKKKTHTPSTHTHPHPLVCN